MDPAEFPSLLSASFGFNENERQLQLDLQNANLVADLCSTPPLDASLLIKRLSNNDWFHILILSTREADGTADTECAERLIVLFTSPHDKQMPFDSSPGLTTYVWRYGLIQLLPDIIASRTGGLGASFERGTIKFSPHSAPSHESTIVTVDLKTGTVTIECTGSALLQLKLQSLKCYHLSGVAVTVRVHLSGAGSVSGACKSS